MAAVGAEPLDDLKAVAVGEHDVEHHEIGAECSRRLSGVGAGGGDFDVEAFVAEGGCDEVGDVCLVVDDENSVSHPCWESLSAVSCGRAVAYLSAFLLRHPFQVGCRELPSIQRRVAPVEERSDARTPFCHPRSSSPVGRGRWGRRRRDRRPGLSGASTTSSSTESAANGNSGSGNATTAPNGRKPRAGALGGDFAAAAKALNLTTEQLMQKLSDGKTTIADVAKQQNVDINDVINAMAAADRQRIDDIVNNPLPEVRRGQGRPGPGGLRRFGGIAAAGSTRPRRHSASRPSSCKPICATASRSPTSPRSKNVPVPTSSRRSPIEADARIDQAVKDGKLTQAQADNAKKKVDDVITELVNGTPTRVRWARWSGHGWRFRHASATGTSRARATASSSATTVPPVTRVSRCDATGNAQLLLR